MKHIHHSKITAPEDPNEIYYAVIGYNVDEKKLVTISDFTLHTVKDNIVKEKNTQELNCETIKLAVDLLLIDKIINEKTLLYNL
jgi:hypothetical protein